MTQQLDPMARPKSAARRRATRSAGACGALTVALGVSVALGGTAQGAERAVTCGSTVTADVTLTADLHCPSGDGIFLGAGVTLDLGGHSLIGGSSGVGVQTTGDIRGGNAIRNGMIENWGTGILLQEEVSDRVPYIVSDVVLRSAPVVQFVTGTSLHMTRVTAVDSQIENQLSGDLVISRSTLTRSAVLLDEANATIVDSTLVQSPVDSADSGIIVIRSSRLDGKGKGGPASHNGGVLTIDDSVVRNFAEPIRGLARVTLTDNKFAEMPNGVLGDISSGFGFGSEVTAVISGNTFTRSGVALRGNVPMIVENNTFDRNEVGVEFTIAPALGSIPEDPPPTAQGSRAVGNVLTKNTGTGIKTELSGLEVGGNTATKNGGYGIYAPGAVDVGGNVASRNALGQCVGVICASK